MKLIFTSIVLLLFCSLIIFSQDKNAEHSFSKKRFAEGNKKDKKIILFDK